MLGNKVRSYTPEQLILGLDKERFLSTFRHLGPDIVELCEAIGDAATSPSTHSFLLVFCRLFDQTAGNTAPRDMTPAEISGHLIKMHSANYRHVTESGRRFELTKLYMSSLAELGSHREIFRATIARLYARRHSLN